MQNKARVVSIANQKGGVGKTTTAVNLAASLAVLERRVLLIDLDPQGAVAPCFGVDRKLIKGGALDLFVHGGEIVKFIIPVGKVDLGIVPVNVWNDEDEEAYLHAVSSEILTKALDEVRPFYDYIIFDNPPTVGPVAVASLTASDSVLIPVQCEDMSVRTLGRLMQLERKIAQRQNPRLTLEGILLTMVDGRTTMTARIVNTMRRNFGNVLFQTVVPRSVDLAKIVARGQPLLFTHVATRGAQAYLALAAELKAREKRRMVS